jgi:hypothetical protein
MGNTAIGGGCGGGLFATGKLSSARLEGVQVYGNRGNDGAGLCAHNASILSVNGSGSIIVNNTAAVGWGAILGGPLLCCGALGSARQAHTLQMPV